MKKYTQGARGQPGEGGDAGALRGKQGQDVSERTVIQAHESPGPPPDIAEHLL